jgi:pyruvate formate lyase activating enzyme
MKEAMYWERAGGGRVKCLLCPHGCSIGEGKRGVCTARMNLGGKLYSLTYGMVVSGHVDPIEKKPIYHFAPGSGVYSYGTLGCTFKCRHCQNHTLSMTEPPSPSGAPDGAGGKSGLSAIVDMFSRRGVRLKTPEEAIEDALASGAEGIAWTYNEPTVWYEFMLDASRLARKKGLYVVTVTNGFINPEPLRELTGLLDATNIDLKSFEDGFYKKQCKGRLAPVLDRALQTKKAGVHVELTTLVIPTRNDDPGMIKKEAEWIRDNLGAETPLHFSRFRPDYMEMDLPPTPEETVIDCARVARKVGLEHVFIGNMYSRDFSDTTCPDCGATVISRRGFLGAVGSKGGDGKCPSCGTEVYRTWKGGVK